VLDRVCRSVAWQRVDQIRYNIEGSLFYPEDGGSLLLRNVHTRQTIRYHSPENHNMYLQCCEILHRKQVILIFSNFHVVRPEAVGAGAMKSTNFWVVTFIVRISFEVITAATIKSTAF
jgi:hypothetical protein